MTIEQLSAKDRRALDALLASSTDGQVLKRAIALKQWDEGLEITRIAAMLQVNRRSIHNWLARLSGDENVPLAQRLSDGPRSGRPSHIKGVIDPLIDSGAPGGRDPVGDLRRVGGGAALLWPDEYAAAE